MPESTPRLGLQKPIEGEADWDVPLRASLDTIDTVCETIEGAQAKVDAHAESPHGGGGAEPTWTTYNPELKQGTTVVAHTKVFAEYMEVGDMVFVRGSLAPTGNGTAGQAVTVSLPSAADFAVGPPSYGFPAGIGRIRDDSATGTYQGLAFLNTATTFWFMPLTASGASALGVNTFTQPLGPGDSVTFTLSYKKAA